jgi:probable DNA metabolism protein
MELFDDDPSFAEFSEGARQTTGLEDLLERLGEVCPNAGDDAQHALLYGYSDHSPARPPVAAIRRFAEKVLAAAEQAGRAAAEKHTNTQQESRDRAEQVRTDRLDPDTGQVQIAASKVLREFDRLRGLLRFSPEQGPETMHSGEAGNPKVRYTARCAPDHFVLPLLADHFFLRFGTTSWAVIDEKRNLVLSGEQGKEPVLRQLTPKEQKSRANPEQGDEWEGLWKNYHRSINNEDRSNPELQKQFMPRRYWKYLPEMDN